MRLVIEFFWRGFRTGRWPMVWLALIGNLATLCRAELPNRPHVVFVMADDMGWGETSYRRHPVLRTPNLDAMAAAGLRFERFYAGGPVCSPTRASVLTGRSPDRCGVLSHGYALRKQEKTVAQALQRAGYVTGHFGKWHLDGYRGPGVPILSSDAYHPGHFGFDEWVSVTNFFDRDPLLSHQGTLRPSQGDSSEIIVGEALRFLDKHRRSGKPMFCAIWFGSPHSPFRASPDDRAAFGQLNEQSAHHYGELVAMDRAIGTLRQGLRQMGLAENTLLVFCSDNGGLPNIEPDTVGGLRGFKGSLYEGGVRVPGIIEWPGIIQPRITHFPACTMDLFPTVADIVGLPNEAFVQPLDGISLKPLLTQEQHERPQPIGFRYNRQVAVLDNDWKLLARRSPSGQLAQHELYNLSTDPIESRNRCDDEPQIFERLRNWLVQWDHSVEASFRGEDYPEKRLEPPDVVPRFWYEAMEYQPFLEEWSKRWEYRAVLERRMQQ